VALRSLGSLFFITLLGFSGCGTTNPWIQVKSVSEPRVLAERLQVTPSDEFTAAGPIVHIHYEPLQRCVTTITGRKVETTHQFSMGGYLNGVALVALAFTAAGFVYCANEAKSFTNSSGNSAVSRSQCTNFVAKFGAGSMLFILLKKGVHPGSKPPDTAELQDFHRQDSCSAACRVEGRDVYLLARGNRYPLGQLNSRGDLDVKPSDVAARYPALKSEPLFTLLGAFTRVDTQDCQ